MRILTLAIMALGAITTAEPVRAQTYDPGYPVCLHVYGPVSYFECRYKSVAQCETSASGRAAQCELNPYVAQAQPAMHHTRRLGTY